MRLGIFYGAAGRLLDGDALAADVQAAHDAGFPSYWLPHLPRGGDALTSLVIAGRAVPDIELGTAVVPTWPRHPLALAQQALTTNLAVGGRLSLGIGLAHKPVVEGMWGTPFERPVRHLKEYLAVLGPALRNEKVSFAGELLTGRSQPIFPEAPAPKLYVAALGEQMLRLTGAEADGTILWMTGPKTISGHTLPVIREAAERAGRPRPRVLVGVPVLCTDDVSAGKALAAEQFQVYGQLPSYRAMLDREGYDGPADMAVVGDEATVRARLEELADAGADDLLCSEFGDGDEALARTRACLAGLARATR
jgi:5,10-methylenetetrahydromethanopterin reductase